MHVFRTWPPPARSDLKLYAWAGEQGEGFARYAGFEVGFWPAHRPDFGGQLFDAIFSANFIEHIDDPVEFVRWAVSRLKAGGRIYLEWPRLESIDLPSNRELALANVNVMTGRYHDDGTHRALPPTADSVRAAILGAGLSIHEFGLVGVPYFDQQLAIHARRENDLVAMTMAYWSYTQWCQYLIAQA